MESMNSSCGGRIAFPGENRGAVAGEYATHRVGIAVPERGDRAKNN